MKISVEDLEFRRAIDHLYGLGPRAVGEFIQELAKPHGWKIDDAVLLLFMRYGKITREMVDAVGADRWPTVPLTGV